MSILRSFNSKWWLRVFCYISYIGEADFWVSPKRLSCSGTRMMFAPQTLLTKLMHFSHIQLTVWLQPSALTRARTYAQARTQNTSMPLQGIPPARSSNFNSRLRRVSLWMSYSRNHISEFFSHSFSIARCLSIRQHEFIIKTFLQQFSWSISTSNAPWNQQKVQIWKIFYATQFLYIINKQSVRRLRVWQCLPLWATLYWGNDRCCHNNRQKSRPRDKRTEGTLGYEHITDAHLLHKAFICQREEPRGWVGQRGPEGWWPEWE